MVGRHIHMFLSIYDSIIFGMRLHGCPLGAALDDEELQSLCVFPFCFRLPFELHICAVQQHEQRIYAVISSYMLPMADCATLSQD